MEALTNAAPEREDAGQHPLVTLLLGSGAAAVVVAVISVWALAASTDVGRIRELEIFQSARLLFEDTFGFSLLARLPVVFNRPFDLNALAPFLTFVALSIAATLAVCWAVAAGAAPLLMILRRWIGRTPDQRVGRWLWTRAYPLGVLVGFALPAMMIPVRGALVASRLTIFGVSLAVAFLVWLALLALLRQPDRIWRFVRISSVACLTVAAVTGAAGALAVALERRPDQPLPAPEQPNILLVSIDSLRRDHLRCYGYARDTSPTIDALARDGVLFTTVVSPTSWTLPAHLTLLTALPPEQHGVIRDGERLGDDALFLSEVLWHAGYNTAGFVSAPYLDAVYGYAQGFDHYDDYTVAKRSLVASHHGVTSPDLIRITSRWLDDWNQRGRQRPFFLFVHMWDVHYDYTPPPPYDAMFDPGYEGTMTGENFQGPKVHAGMNPRDLEHIVALYDGEIRFTDLHLGYLLDHLRRLGILDQTVVVVTADHGDEFFEHGRKGHKQALYDETILVPLVIRYPAKVPAGRRVEPQVRLMDIPVTTLALAGVARPAAFGASAVPPVQAARDLGPWIVSDSADTPPALPAFSDLIGDAPVPVASVRTDAYKLIQEQKGARREELYDLTSDPAEHVNIAASDDALNARLRAELVTWRDACGSGRKLSRKAQLSDAHKERLRALGYAE